MTDDFHTPQRHDAPSKGTVAAVLNRAASAGSSLLSILTGLLAAVLILYSGYVLYDTFYTQEQAFSSGWEVLQYKPEIIEDGMSPKAGQDMLQSILDSYRAWLTMNDTSIDYPVVQGDDDLFYASHDIYGEPSLTGSIYLAAGNTADLSDTYNLIYGHHMDNGAMFGALDEYLKTAYIASHRDGVLVTPVGVWDLKVFAVIETDAYESKVYSVGPSRTAEDVLSFLEAPGGNTAVRYYDAAAAKDAVKITALSTCADANTNGRLVVFCVTTLRNLITVELPDYTGVYDGQGHFTTAKVNYPDDTTVEYSSDGGKTWQKDPPRITNVGTMTVTVRATNDFYGRAIGTATYTVTPAPVTVEALPAAKYYDTEDPGFSYVVKGRVDDYAFNCEVTRPGAGTDENVNEYPDALVPSGAERQGNYIITYVPASFTILPAPMDVVAVDYDGVYDGEFHFGAAFPSVTAGTTVQFRLTRQELYQNDSANDPTLDGALDGAADDDEGWTEEAPSIKNIGRYLYEARAINDNYVTAYDSAVLVVRPRPVTVQADAKWKYYGADDPEFTETVTGLLNGDSVDYTTTRPGAGADEAPGTYEGAIIPTGEAEQGNYIVTYIPGTFTIYSAPSLTVYGTDYYATYDGQAHPASAYASVPDALVEYSTDGVNWSATPPTITNVGSLTVYLRATHPDYETATGTLTMTVTRAPLTVRANPAAKQYLADDPAFSAVVSGLLDGFYPSFTLSRLRVGIDEAVDVYVDVIVPTGAREQGNYYITYYPADFTITPLAMTLTAIGYEGIYDGETHGLTARPSIVDGTLLEYSIDGGATWSTTPPTIRDVGRIEVVVRATNPNYGTVEATVVLEVTPKAVVVRAAGITKLQGAQDPELTAYVEGLIGDDEIIYIVTRVGGDEAPGTYYDVIVPSGEALQGNYIVTYIPASMTIVNLPGGVPASAANGTPGDPNNPADPDNPEEEIEDIQNPTVPLTRFFERFRPKGSGGTPAWALVNLLCLIATCYLFIPLLHLRDKFGRKQLMKRINRAKVELREATELLERESEEKLRINMLAARRRAMREEGATEESIEAAVAAEEAIDFLDIREDEFSAAVDELYYKVQRFMRRFRAGLVSELILCVLALVWFIWTEDMRLPMILVDKWTPLMVLFLVVTWFVDVRLARYREKVLAEEAEDLEYRVDEAQKDLESV